MDFRECKTEETDESVGTREKTGSSQSREGQVIEPIYPQEETDEGTVKPCSAPKADRQISFTKAATEERDFPVTLQAKGEKRVETTCIQEAEAEAEEKPKKMGNEKNEISHQDTGRDEEEPTGNQMSDKKTLDFEEDGKLDQAVNFKDNQTAEDVMMGSESNSRTFKTEEDRDDIDVPAQICYPRPRNGSVVNTQVVFKVSHIRSHPKNDPPEKMINSLPSLMVKRRIGESLSFGRGEKIDVYLHDCTASKRHLELKVIARQRTFTVQIKNISETKLVKLNSTRKIESNQSISLENNDQLTIGCFTFLVEIAPGDEVSTQYNITFKTIVDTSGCRPQSPGIYGQPAPLEPQYQPFGYGQPNLPQGDPFQRFTTPMQYGYYPAPPRGAMFPADVSQQQLHGTPLGYQHMPRQQYLPQQQYLQQQPPYTQQQQHLYPPQQQQYPQQQQQQLALQQQMNNMSLHPRRTAEEHDERYGTEATDPKSRSYR